MYVLLCTLWDVSQEYVRQIDVLLCTLWDVSQEYIQPIDVLLCNFMGCKSRICSNKLMCCYVLYGM